MSRHTRGADCEICEGFCHYAEPQPREAAMLRAATDRLAENLVMMERSRAAITALRDAAVAALFLLEQYEQIPAAKAKATRKQLRAAIALGESA